MQRTRFSVVITCRNQRGVISDAIRSALAQAYTAHEVIVVDDASTDGSDAILAGYANHVRLVFLKSNQGPPAARNAGAALARGDYLVYLDGDDVLKTWALDVYDQVIRAREPVLLVGSLAWFRGTFVDQPDDAPPKQIQIVSYDNWVEKDHTFRSCASAMVIKRETFESVDGWSKEVWPFEDHYLAARLAYAGRAIHILYPPTVNYRTHSANTIHNVPLLVNGCYRLVAAWAAYRRFRGMPKRLERWGLIGGPALWVVKKAFRAGKSLEGLKLLYNVWLWVTAAGILRLRALLFGRHPIEIFSIQLDPPLAARRATFNVHDHPWHPGPQSLEGSSSDRAQEC